MSTEPTAGPPVAELSYEEARDELVAIVARIEGGDASLEESMVLWERGEALAAHCQAKLDQAQEQLDRGAAGAGSGAAGGPGSGDAADADAEGAEGAEGDSDDA